MRPGCHIGEGAHVGNFVEVKMTRLGMGSKANHLTYLGDAEIGAGVNIGAGTITCNYDGVNKHKTLIGDHVFIGSDSALVAPVVIGEGAYVAPGSTITDDVPADALAAGAGRQVNKPGWAKNRRAQQRGAQGQAVQELKTIEGNALSFARFRRLARRRRAEPPAPRAAAGAPSAHPGAHPHEAS